MTGLNQKINTQKRIIVIVGPSGSGKTAISKELAKRGYPKLVTSTSRLPRVGELEGVDYYFLDRSDFNDGDFVEHTNYNENIYGLSKAEVIRKLTDYDTVQLAMDQNGAQAMLDKFPEETVIVFVTISKKTMAERMRARGDGEDEIQARIQHSVENGEYIPPQGTQLCLENNDLDECVQAIVDLIGQ